MFHMIHRYKLAFRRERDRNDVEPDLPLQRLVAVQVILRGVAHFLLFAGIYGLFRTAERTRIPTGTDLHEHDQRFVFGDQINLSSRAAPVAL